MAKRTKRNAPASKSKLKRTRATISTREFRLPIAGSWKRANYAYPRGVGKDAGKRASYPIYPKARARAARTYAARPDTAGTLAHVDYAIRQRYGKVQAIYSGTTQRGGAKRTGRRAR